MNIYRHNKILDRNIFAEKNSLKRETNIDAVRNDKIDNVKNSPNNFLDSFEKVRNIVETVSKKIENVDKNNMQYKEKSKIKINYS